MLYLQEMAEGSGMAEAVLRQHKKRADRWLAREKRYPTREQVER